ncbi:MAG: FtsX-like permease family protein [Panacibacter sp.]
MLKNYFKIAIAVLKRRKFFTFISLFGISFTLTILIVLTAFIDNTISPNYPEVNRDRSLYIISIQQKDTVHQGQMTGPASYYFMSHFAGTLKTPEKVAISSMFVATNTYVNNKKLVINMKYTNDAFWDVMQFRFIEGKPYSRQQIDNSEHVAVISEDTKKDYFGDMASVVGNYIEADNVEYRITGVVKSVPVTMPVSYADLYVPYTVSKADYRKKTYRGNYTAVLLAKSKDDLPEIQQEFANVVARIPPENKDFNILNTSADPYLQSFIAMNNRESGVAIIVTVIVVFALFVMLLPTLNLININISRIMERSSEIGVRKAFGASSKTLVYQFITENIILTFFGAAIGLLLSYIILQVINNSNLISNLHLTINLTVLFYSLLACLFFGLLSGVYPAWRMSRLHVVTALKA